MALRTDLRIVTNDRTVISFTLASSDYINRFTSSEDINFNLVTKIYI